MARTGTDLERASGNGLPVVIAGVATAHLACTGPPLAYCVATAALVAAAGTGGEMLRGQRPASRSGRWFWAAALGRSPSSREGALPMSTQNITHRLADAPGQHEEPLRFLVRRTRGGRRIRRRAPGRCRAPRDGAGAAAKRRAAACGRTPHREPRRDQRAAADVVTADQLTSGHDAIVLAVKSGDLDGAMADIEPAVKPPTVIVPFLNGMATSRP